MSKQPLSLPAVIVNNETIGIVPGSLTYKGGETETKVSAISTGGGGIESSHTEDASNAISEVKFSVVLTGDVDGKIADWKSKTAQNVVMFTERVMGNNEKRTFTGMSLTNHPERAVSPDGKVELIFQGDPMI